MSKERVSQYQTAYMADYGFESVMVRYRRQFLVERLMLYRPKVVIEIGCGSELLYESWRQMGGHADSWVIVEPASEFAAIARASKLPNQYVIEEFFEHSIPKIMGCLQRSPEMVICSGLLHEVPSAIELLQGITSVMDTETILHVNVPNADSMHRRLAIAMGLITSTKSFSDRNVALLQHRVYDAKSLKEDIATTGLRIVDEGGYFIKPFTHGQMKNIVPDLGDPILDGLYNLGKSNPEWASEIFIEAKL